MSTSNQEDISDLEVDSTTSDNLVFDASVNKDISDLLMDAHVDKDIEQIRLSKDIALTEIYKIIVDTRKFEIENFWKRAIFFWGTIALLLAGYFNAKNSEQYLIFAAYVGLFYNIIFSLSLRGSKYWQEHWETTSTAYEKAMKFKIFQWDASTKIKDDNKDVFPLLRPKRFSVSKLTMLLSDMTISLWLILIAKDFSYLWSNNLVHFAFTLHGQIDFFTAIVVLLPLLFFIYLSIFLYWGNKNSPEKQKGN